MLNQSAYTMPMNTAKFQTVRPPTGTQEWAASNVNIQDGCEHDYRYCYAKTMAIRLKWATLASTNKGNVDMPLKFIIKHVISQS